jgi:hypothetical protein
LEETEAPDWPGKVYGQYKAWSLDPTGIFCYWNFHRVKEITDGLSKTFIIGEKYVQPELYETGQDKGDDQNMYHGIDRDTLRFATKPTSTQKAVPPQQDTPGVANPCAFGSVHSVVLMSLCDGSVNGFSFDIDPEMWSRLANRKDGEIVSY